MGVVGPIKDKQVLERMKEILREKSTRDYLMFRIGLNLGLSTQDLLMLQVEDVAGKSEYIVGNCKIQICPSLQREIENYIGDRKSGHLFRSPKGKPISRFRLYATLRSLAKATDFNEPIGSLTLRKTFAYWAYQNEFIYLPLLSRYLNHHTTQYTLRYIDVEKEEESEGVSLVALDI